jgi:protein SCO1/2
MSGRISIAIAVLLASATLSGRQAQSGSPWGAEYFPNVPLVTQDGKTVHFYDDLIKGKRVLLNFIFSSCDNACPLATAKLLQVQKRLGPRIGRDIFIYSITLDPEHDSPEALKAYAARYGAGPGWLFLTGTRKDIDALRLKLGERRDKAEHPNIVRIGNGVTNQWMRLPLDGDVNLLVSDIGKNLDPNWYSGKSADWADAPHAEFPGAAQVQLREQALFRNRCGVCHTLGSGDYLGPDLKDVANRRDRAWLLRYLAEPDRMRAQKDPTALALASRYKVLMPKLGLTEDQLLDLVDYLESLAAPRVPGPGRDDPLPLRRFLR